MSLIHLIYFSTLIGNDESVLKDIHQIAIANNVKNDVTGMLLYSHRRFLQVLEGESEAVHLTYKYICRDSRHNDIHLLLTDTIENRSFTGWSMGFHHVNDVEIQQSSALESFFLCNSNDIVGQDGVALGLLKTFLFDA